MNLILQSISTFSLQGQARLLAFKGKKLLCRDFGTDIIGSIYQIGNQLFELFTDQEGKAIMVKPISSKTIELYLDSIDIRDAFRC